MTTITRELLQKSLYKKYGEDVFHHTFEPTGYIDSGIPTLNRALGRPGYALGRLTVIRGDFSTGKSSLVHAAIAACQQAGGVAALFETEDAIDPAHMAALGVNFAELEPLIFQPAHVEEALQLMDDLIDVVREQEPTNPVLIVWDSIAATPLKMELEEDIGKAPMAGHAKLIGQGLRKLTRKIGQQRISLLWVNQTRSKMSSMPFADNTTMLADAALKFHASAMLKVARTGKEGGAGKDDDYTGIKMKVTVEKNKLAPPFREATISLDFAQGFLIEDAWLTIAEEERIVKRSGAWYTYEGQKFQRAGWPALRAADAALRARLENTTRAEQGVVEEPVEVPA